MQKDEDMLIKKMAKLLREGATMLDKTCPKCGTLIYRLPNKKIICPSCNSEIVIQKESKSPSNEISIPSKYHHDFSSILNTLYSKIDTFNTLLLAESDTFQIEKLLNLIEKALLLYEKIYKLHTQLHIH
ncbi:MAG: hypothetical protein JW776_02780 [Candidatus Lokiarchaeota archaeon]|nr:hypothetical protein [Candidatus Lokiarchaeota archaeon]